MAIVIISIRDLTPTLGCTGRSRQWTTGDSEFLMAIDVLHKCQILGIPMS